MEDTIAAVATAMAPSGIGIVRISGPDAVAVADRLYRGKREEKRLENVKSHTIHYGWIVEQEQVLDEVLVMLMRGPHSTLRRKKKVRGTRARVGVPFLCFAADGTLGSFYH
ncbi:hypothetical protein [uncultured Desulfovibrio sp.]|uniref:hypothetical protein n=1 Tax=uncultured Desulfovibrio sp. TaxID=167968 RepID=UPI0026225177|nr:hypothetical protein [uncultured Desulfovibrio sp.]